MECNVRLSPNHVVIHEKLIFDEKTGNIEHQWLTIRFEETNTLYLFDRITTTTIELTEQEYAIMVKLAAEDDKTSYTKPYEESYANCHANDDKFTTIKYQFV